MRQRICRYAIEGLAIKGLWPLPAFLMRVRNEAAQMGLDRRRATEGCAGRVCVEENSKQRQSDGIAVAISARYPLRT